MEPTIGRIVLYKLKESDIDRIQAMRNAGVQVNSHAIGDVVPAIVVRPWHEPGRYTQGVSCLNAKAFLDGERELWVLSAQEGTSPGTWAWMPYQKGQAAKTEALEAQLAASYNPDKGHDTVVVQKSS